MPKHHPTEPLRQWTREHCPDVDFDHEIAVLRDHEFKTPYSDWDAVIRNWMRKAQRFYQERKTTSSRPVTTGRPMSHAEVMAAIDAATDPNSEDFDT